MNCIVRSEVRTNSNPARGKGIFLEHNNCRNRLRSKLFNKKHFVLRHQLDSDVMFVVNYSDNRTSGTSACMWFFRLVSVLVWEPQLWHFNVTHWYHNRWQHLERPNWKHWYLQGVFFNWSPPKFSKYKSLYNLWHLEKLWASLHGILYLENLGGLQFKKTSCRWQH